MKARGPLLDKVQRCLAQHGADGGMVVAVSGGPDSVALLRALVAVKVRVLVVAHLNHQLRGAESDADQQFVEELAAQLGLPCRVHAADVAGQARAAGDNQESVGRRVRYAWLATVAEETGCRWIATGHTADDQAETVLHRLLRGAGLQGLRGIAPRREIAPGIFVLRPILQATRAEVLAFLEKVNQTCRHDRSNLDPAFTRNRIRHELLPLLTTYNPAAASVLARLAGQAEDAWSEIEGLARALLVAAERPRARALVILDRPTLVVAPPARVREMFRLVWAREGWPQGDMTTAAWERLVELVRGEILSFDLPGGVCAACRERVVQVGRAL